MPGYWLVKAALLLDRRTAPTPGRCRRRTGLVRPGGEPPGRAEFRSIIPAFTFVKAGKLN
jgi:hypothetical protein